MPNIKNPPYSNKRPIAYATIDNKAVAIKTDNKFKSNPQMLIFILNISSTACIIS